MPVPPYLKRRYMAELNKTIILTQLVTIEFPQHPSHGTVTDQHHLEGKRREGVYKRENRIIRIWTRSADRGGTKRA